jgi:hypothetical protein
MRRGMADSGRIGSELRVLDVGCGSGYEVLLDKMASLTRPAEWSLGDEPNRLAHRCLAPLVRLWRSTINRYRTEDAEALLGDPEFESLSEYFTVIAQR